MLAGPRLLRQPTVVKMRPADYREEGGASAFLRIYKPRAASPQVAGTVSHGISRYSLVCSHVTLNIE